MKSKEKKQNKDRGTLFEDLLFKTCITFFIVLIAVQLILVIPSARVRLGLDKGIGAPLSADEYLYSQGHLTLKLIGDNPDPTVRILVNGDEIAMFENLEMPLSVRDGDVIEIDGSQSLNDYMVRIGNVSANINSNCLDAVAKVKSNIKMLVKVQVD